MLPGSVNFTGKRLCWSLFLIRENTIKNILKRGSNAGFFLQNCEIFKNTPAAASDHSNLYFVPCLHKMIYEPDNDPSLCFNITHEKNL